MTVAAAGALRENEHGIALFQVVAPVVIILSPSLTSVLFRKRQWIRFIQEERPGIFCRLSLDTKPAPEGITVSVTEDVDIAVMVGHEETGLIGNVIQPAHFNFDSGDAQHVPKRLFYLKVGDSGGLRRVRLLQLAKTSALRRGHDNKNSYIKQNKKCPVNS